MAASFFRKAIIIGILSLCPVVAQQTAPAVQAYAVDEAYQVYSVLLAHEEAAELGKDVLLIREETERGSEDLRQCIAPQAATSFEEALKAYSVANERVWRLERRFVTDFSYELISSAAIKAYMHDGWDSFYQRFPQAGGYIVFSAVGFNADRTMAVVYSGTDCGTMCGRWRFHLLRKVDGRWKEVPDVTCVTVS